MKSIDAPIDPASTRVNGSRLLEACVIVLGCVVVAAISYGIGDSGTFAGGFPVHAGITAALMLSPERHRTAGVALGVLLCNFVYALVQPLAWTAAVSGSAVVAAALFVQGSLGARWVKRWVSYPNSLHGTRDAIVFLLCIGPCACVSSAAVVTTWLWATNALTAGTFLHELMHWWVCNTIAVLLVVPLLLAFIGEPAPAWRSRRKTLASALVVGSAVMLTAVFHTRALERAASMAGFREDAGALSKALEQELVYVLSAPDALAQLWFVSDVSREQFRTASARAREQHSSIQALEWLPRVARNQRTEHESRGRAELRADYQIRERSQHAGLVRAADRDIHFPVFYVEPMSGNEAAVGFDLASEPIRAATIARALATGKASVSPGINLVQAHGTGARAVLAVMPVLDKRGRSSGAGLVLCVVRLQQLLERAVHLAAHDGIAIRLEDVNGADGDAFLAGYGLEGTDAQPTTPFVVTRELRAGDRSWRLTCWKSAALLASFDTWRDDYGLLRALFFSAVLSTLLLLITGRLTYTEALVAERTAELSAMNDHLLEAINTRWKAQCALTESEARWQFALDGAEAGVWDWTLHRDEVFYSSTWKQMLGYASHEPGPSMAQWREHVHPDDLARCEHEFSLLLQSARDVYHVELRMLRKDGTVIWTSTRGKVVARASDGSALRVIGTQTDISERKAAERELERHRDHLDDLVRARTQELDRALHVAERANSAKSLFLRNMSHEVRTPLHAILSYAQIGAELADVGLREYFSRVISTATQLHKLLGNLLELASLQGDQSPLRTHLCDVEGLVTAVASELSGELAMREQRILLSRPPRDSSTLVQGDSERLTTVFRQLLINAGRYSASGATVRVAYVHLPATNQHDLDRLEVRLIDQGVGIADDELETIFDSFVQGSRTRTNAGGTGIGLAICREIIVRHGGTVHAENNAVGASFVVRLPVARASIMSAAS